MKKEKNNIIPITYKNPNHYLAGKKRSDWVINKIKEGIRLNKKITKPETIDKMRKNRKTMTPIIQYDLEGNFIREWISQAEASRHYKINSTGIMNCCKGKQNTACGYKWEYKLI